MTINIAVKCPQGIALGTDSLVSLLTKDGLATAFSPFYRKLFRLGACRFSREWGSTIR